tara:strand:- start:245 stop:916 length:672 start_codon:yes stop_codon:yes gene_type:complete
MHQQKGKKIFIYLFFMILVGSINNLELYNYKIFEIRNINISGLTNLENSELKKKIKNLNLKNILLFNRFELSQIIDSNPLVQNYEIVKIYPSSIDIKIIKTKLLAKLNKDGKTLFLGSNGKLSEYNFSKKSLPFIFGNPDSNDFLNLKNKIDESKFSYGEIKNFYFFPSGRWDLELKNNTLIKLSENKINDSLDYAFDFMKNNNIDDFRVIDLRIKNQIILND